MNGSEVTFEVFDGSSSLGVELVELEVLTATNKDLLIQEKGRGIHDARNLDLPNLFVGVSIEEGHFVAMSHSHRSSITSQLNSTNAGIESDFVDLLLGSLHIPPTHGLIVGDTDQLAVSISISHLLDAARVARDRGQGRLVLLEIENTNELVIGSGGQVLGIGRELDGLDDMLVLEGEIFFAIGSAPDLG